MAERAKTRQVPDISLKQQILEWWAALPEPTTREVADLCGCGTEYVRVVVRQRKGNGISDIDRIYSERFKERHGTNRSTYRYNKIPGGKEMHRARQERYYIRKFGSVDAGVRHFYEVAKAKASKERV